MWDRLILSHTLDFVLLPTPTQSLACGLCFHNSLCSPQWLERSRMPSSCHRPGCGIDRIHVVSASSIVWTLCSMLPNQLTAEPCLSWRVVWSCVLLIRSVVSPCIPAFLIGHNQPCDLIRHLTSYVRQCLRKCTKTVALWDIVLSTQEIISWCMQLQYFRIVSESGLFKWSSSVSSFT